MSETMTGTKKLAVCAMCIALAFMLNQVSLFRMPMGGSITPFSMLFIVLAGYWLGPVWGILAGVAMGLLNTSTGAIVYAPHQYVLDYLLAPGALGLSGLFRKWRYGLQIGYIVGVLGRFLMVFLSGYLVFYMYAGDQHPAIYSATYNMAYIGPEMVVTLIIISLPVMKHAIDTVTKSVLPPNEYAEMMKNQGSSSANARLITGGVMGALGGTAFVLSSYITRLENLSIMHVAAGVELFSDPPRADRLYRMIERNTGQIFALQTVGVLFVALGVTLIFSTLMAKEDAAK